ncbi:hypothetical protein EVAR_10194_1 [Eumeta japonica]|uniref:Uncharacterized protein n=1 Tax=Eumeta variegata TaxID=151549 RepID=A0A4C1TDD9_EUMVA|nr:hypothetical protein EVAR_10194_1 [Eumeta japonica]
MEFLPRNTAVRVSRCYRCRATGDYYTLYLIRQKICELSGVEIPHPAYNSGIASPGYGHFTQWSVVFADDDVNVLMKSKRA